MNPDAVNIEATLDLHPYYLFEYQAEVKKGLLRRSEMEYGLCVVDATNKKIIQGIENDARYREYAQSFFSKEGMLWTAKEDSHPHEENNNPIGNVIEVEGLEKYTFKIENEDGGKQVKVIVEEAV